MTTLVLFPEGRSTSELCIGKQWWHPLTSHHVSLLLATAVRRFRRTLFLGKQPRHRGRRDSRRISKQRSWPPSHACHRISSLN